MRFIATCKLGLESTVSFQLKKLNIEVEKTLDARVFFKGDYHTMARALLWLRSAERVLLEVGSFRANSFDELFEGTKALNWRDYIRPDSAIHVNGKSAKSGLFSVSDCQRIVKKAIADKVKASYGLKNLSESGGEVIVEVGMLRDEATLALDCCGAGLSRRGYRTFNVPAPLSETLGAGIILLSSFFPDTPLIDPMCGSGTMPIEAAMIAQNRAPGLNRSFAAESWAFLPKDAFKLAREEAQDGIINRPVQILGSDIDAHNIELCKKHAKKAGVMLNWAVRPVEELTTEWRNGVIVCNPPYGERMMRPSEAVKLYGTMRRVFDSLPDWQVNIISAMRDFEKAYGKRADRRRKLSNGGMVCTLYRYFAKRGGKNGNQEE
ncbi:MAG: class I SAM-dependent RNA methyltransferase [Clostridia bacterium]|nr:class I SAM-dependent RNA methyltransferase [Clostridia bacterium]